MKTYGLAKDYRNYIYVVILLVAIVISYVIDYYCVSKIVVPKEFDLIIKIVMSILSFSSIGSLIFIIINMLYKKYNKLNGKYFVVLESSYHNGQESNINIDAEITINIDLIKAKVVLQTKNSVSHSETIFINNDDKGNRIITYTYLNEGNPISSNRLEKHYGTCILSFNKGKLLCGEYYNDGFRKTYGKITTK